MFSQESTAVAMNGLYEMFYRPPVRIGMVGPVLSFITVEIAAVSGLWQFVQVCPTFRLDNITVILD